MDNSEAIGKLLKIIHAADPWSNHDYVDEAHEILAAFQADLIGYFPPKPLEWVECEQLTARWIASAGSHVYRIEEYDIDDFHVWDNQNGWDCFSHRSPTLEAAQAAAYDDLCNRVRELF